MYATLEELEERIGKREHFSDVKNWLVLQYETRPLGDIDKKFIEINQDYCKRHGYDYLLITEEYPLPPYWAKVKHVQEQLPQYKGVFWIDTDAVIVKPDSIDSFFPETKHMMFSPDATIWANQSPFNAGVWMIRNTKQGNEIMSKWMSLYDSSMWRKEDKWNSLGIWAGDTYEQGAFSSHMLPLYRDIVHKLDWSVFQDIKKTDRSFALHFAAEQKQYRQDFLDTFLQK